jgi:hypothetical protein
MASPPRTAIIETTPMMMRNTLALIAEEVDNPAE